MSAGGFRIRFQATTYPPPPSPLISFSPSWSLRDGNCPAGGGGGAGGGECLRWKWWLYRNVQVQNHRDPCYAEKRRTSDGDWMAARAGDGRVIGGRLISCRVQPGGSWGDLGYEGDQLATSIKAAREASRLEGIRVSTAEQHKITLWEGAVWKQQLYGCTAICTRVKVLEGERPSLQWFRLQRCLALCPRRMKTPVMVELV
jgi:hypothetical protein